MGTHRAFDWTALLTVPLATGDESAASSAASYASAGHDGLTDAEWDDVFDAGPPAPVAQPACPPITPSGRGRRAAAGTDETNGADGATNGADGATNGAKWGQMRPNEAIGAFETNGAL